MYNDKNLTCRDCGESFVFSASEQEFFAEKGFENEPTRCLSCRNVRRNRNSTGQSRELYTVTCGNCGVETQVPFQPTGSRPVYCRDCFQQNRSSARY